MRIAVLVKQIPKFEEMELGPDGRLRRDGIEPEMNPYCRRAVSKAVELAAERAGSRVDGVHARTARGRRHAARSDRVGPRSRRRHRRRARDRRRVRRFRHARDRARRSPPRSTREGPFDLVLAGRNSVDADTGQVGPELAELLDLPFLTGVRYLAIDGDTRRRPLRARRRLDAGRGRAARGACRARSGCASRRRSTRPGRAAVPADRIRRLTAADLGPGPWGADASPTWVGPVKVMAVSRARDRRTRRAARRPGARRGAHPPGTRRAARRDADDATETVVRRAGPAAAARGRGRRRARPRAHATRELLGCGRAPGRRDRRARRRDHARGSRPRACSARGAPTRSCTSAATNVEEDVARGGRRLGATTAPPWAIITGSTAWGREVASRVAARLERRPHRRRGRPRSGRRPARSRGSPRSAASSSPRSARRRRSRWRPCAPGMITAPTPRTDRHRAAGLGAIDDRVARTRARARRAPATTTSTRSPTPTR